MSIADARRPSRCAAIASTAPMVTTPVPPMPATSTLHAPGLRAGGAGTSGRACLDGSRRRSWPPCTDTNDGQNPFEQLRSLLQLDWSISRLRPSAVSFGTIDTQFDCTEQSPQPSQTSALMNIRTGGSGASPRLRRRRFSAAQVCS